MEFNWKFIIVCLSLSAVIAVPLFSVPGGYRVTLGGLIAHSDGEEPFPSELEKDGAVVQYPEDVETYLAGHHILVMEQFELLRAEMKALKQKLEYIEITYHRRWDGKEWKSDFPRITTEDLRYSTKGNMVLPIQKLTEVPVIRTGE